ncbi:MAG: ATP-binding protein [Eubacterium sp.]|nr:ATP-binding protein [Eubacterium sp.]
MYEKEKQRTTHLIILLVYTFLTIGLVGESLLLGWEMGAVVLLLLGLVVGWLAHITEKIPESIRLWLYVALTMLTFFFYGIHKTSIYDLAPLMIVVILMYSITEKCTVIKICVATYYLTIAYDFVFVVRRAMNFNSLTITRTILHLVLVFLAGYLAQLMLRRHREERANTENRIAELEETNRRAEDFLTNVSHELRTPINAVTGITTVMLKKEEDVEKRKDISSIQMAGRRLFRQIEDILDYTEIDTGSVRVSEDNYMISSIVNDIITGISLPEKEATPELIFDIDAGIPSVLYGDEKKIKKMMKHLIDNALKFTHKGGIYVRVYALPKPYGVNLCIRVSDTGTGIAEEELGRITEQFYQSNGGRNRRAGGLGLGLPIVYGMVNAMQGFIRIESTEGSGTTVSVSIPQRVSDDAPGMVLENPENLCPACFLLPEKYEIPEVRDYYNLMISHMVQELDVPLHRVSNREELERLISMYQVTHLFIGEEEYAEDPTYFEGMDSGMDIIVVAGDRFTLSEGSRVKHLQKPFFSLSIINILNAGTLGENGTLKKKHIICPDVKVLVVDDEPMNLTVAEGIFHDYQMLVKTAPSGKKALEICTLEDFDLIFLDHMMPEMDGVETLKRLRKIQIDKNKVFTIVAFTANAVSGARKMFLQEGFDEFVSKPVETMELERILKKVLPKSAIAYVEEQERNMTKSEVAEEPDVQKDEMLLLENAGIRTQSGIQYCRGDKEFYGEVLAQFAREAAAKETKIQDFYCQQDMDNYRIQVHALKSASKMIGADELSEMARQVEEAAKNQDVSYITEHQEELLSTYRRVVKKIVDVLDLGNNSPVQTCVDISREELIRYLGELKESLDAYEMDRAESLVSELYRTEYKGTSVEELLAHVAQDVEDFEFDLAAGKVDKLLCSMERGEHE